MKINPKIITFEKFKDVMEQHTLWIERKPGGRQASFSFTDLRSLDLRNFDLSYVVFFGSIFSDLDMRNANLTGADLRSCTMINVDLTGADLTNAKMDRSNLTGANLTKTEMSYCLLDKAILKNANLTEANMKYVSLYDSNLENAKLTGIQSTDSLGGMRVTSVELQTGLRNKKVQVTFWNDLNLVTSRNFQGTINEFKKHIKSNFLNNEDTIRCYERAISYVLAEAEL